MVSKSLKSAPPNCSPDHNNDTPAFRSGASAHLRELEDELQVIGYEFKQLFDNAGDAIRVINKDFTIRRINRAFAEMTGVDQMEVSGKKCWEVFPSPLCHTPDCRLQRILDTSNRIQVDIERQTKDGGTIECSVIASPLKDKMGQTVGVIEQFRDITEHRRMEEQVKESEERYRTLVELGSESGEAIVMLQDQADRIGIQVYCNDCWSRITGYTKEELVNTTFFDLVSPGNRQDLMARHHRRMSGNALSGAYETNIITRNGSEIIVEIIGALTHYQGNRVVVLYIRDITERKRLESTLTDSETRYAYLFENAPVCLLELDFSLIKLHLDELRKQGVADLQDYFNQYPDAVLDCSRLAKVISMNKAYRDLFKAEDLALFNEYFPQPLKNSQLNRKAIGDDYARLYRGVTLFAKEESVHNLKRQKKRVVTSIFIPPGYESNWSRLLLSLFDITELKQKEKRLNISESQLRLLSKRTLTAQEEERSKIARELHDQLVQGIVAIRMEMSLIRDRISNTDTRMGIDRQVRALTDLIDTVRNISKALRPQTLDDSGLVKAIQLYAEEFERRTGISCPVNIQDNVIQQLSLDKEMETAAYRIIQESLLNVIQHARATQTKISIFTRNNKLHISVQDNGIGINVKMLDEKSAIGILGMRERASIVGGVVSIVSPPKKGTTVKLVLPLKLQQI
jgi:PAS domain S-box-containing protein